MWERLNDDWGLIIIVIVVAILILLVLNFMFIFLPINRIERKTDHVINKVGGTVPVVNKAAQDVIGLVNRSLTLENNVENFTQSLGCVICRALSSPPYCQGVRLRPVHQVCPPLTQFVPPPITPLVPP